MFEIEKFKLLLLFVVETIDLYDSKTQITSPLRDNSLFKDCSIFLGISEANNK